MAATRLGYDNTPIVYWIIWEASTINPVVAVLLPISALHSQQFLSTLRNSTIQAWKIAWRITHLASLIYLTSRFFPTYI